MTSAPSPTVSLLEAMRAAEGRDRIAWNYAHDFADIFDLGLTWLAQGLERWSEPSWAATRVYLGFLAHVPDTLIERKFGDRTAARVREEARPIESSFDGVPRARGHDGAADRLRPSVEGARAKPRHLGRSDRGDLVRGFPYRTANARIGRKIAN